MIAYAVLYYQNKKLKNSFVFDNEKEARAQWAWVIYNTGQNEPEDIENWFTSDNGFGDTDDEMENWEFFYLEIYTNIQSIETSKPNIVSELQALVEKYG